MTQPNPSKTGDAAQERIKRGGRIGLDVRKQLPGSIVQANARRVVAAFPGTQDLDAQLAANAANDALLVFTVDHPAGATDVAVLVFINLPDADATTPTTRGFAGAVAFFEHAEHAGRAAAPFTLPLPASLRQAGGPGALSATFVPVAFPGRGARSQTLSVKAAVHLVTATVERTK
jgi:hypothetical protein